MSGNGPLEQLAKKLTPMPSLRHIFLIFKDSKKINDFLKLIREYIPESESRIMTRGDNWAIAHEFAECFGKKYFPLDVDQIDWSEASETIGNFLYDIPISLMGFSYDYYHEQELQNTRPAFLAALALAEYPYQDNNKGARVPILQELAKSVGDDLVEQIPEDGYALDMLRFALKDTQYVGLLYDIEYIYSDTGCFQLDCNWEDGIEPPPWSTENVEALTDEYKQMEERRKKNDAFVEWIEKDMPTNFAEVLKFIQERRTVWSPSKPPEQQTLFQVFSTGNSQPSSTLNPTL